MVSKIAKWTKQGLWTKEMVRHAVSKGVITEEEAAKILNEENEAK
jgi:hypothetical protein